MKIRFYNNTLNVLTFIVMEMSLIFFIVLTVHLNEIIPVIIATVGFVVSSIILVWFMRMHFYRVQIDYEGIT